MRTVQLTLDEGLVDAVDRAAKTLGSTRSAFVRRALTVALEELHRAAMERRHREGYRKHPVRQGEFDTWEDEQVWVEP